MPDDEKEKSSGPEGQWNDPIETGATFPPVTISASDPEDYKKWAQERGGWRKLRAAVTGGAAMSTENGRQHAGDRVNAQSVMDAGAVFDLAGRTFAELGPYLLTHARAIAGEGKPWQGPAADAFLGQMEYLAKILDAQSERITGPPGTGGSRSIPQQLYNDANALAYAQYSMEYYDHAFANLARQSGNAVGADGLVSITGSPLEAPMTQRMEGVIDVLANQYGGFAHEAVVPVRRDNPSTVLSPAPSPPAPPPPAPPPPGGPNLRPPNFNNASNGNGSNGPNLSLPNPPPIPRPNGNATTGPNGPALNLPNVPNPNVPRPTVPNPNAPIPNVPNPTVPRPTVPNPNAPNLNLPGPPVLPRPNGTGVNTPGIGRPGGLGGGTGSGITSPTPPRAPIAPPAPVAPAVRPPALPNAGAIGSGVNVPGLTGTSGNNAGGIPPGAPPGSPGGAGSGSGVPDRPDASGLLEGDAEAWKPVGDPAPRPPDVGSFTPPGGAGLQTSKPASGAAAPGGMPTMPGSPAPGAPGGNGSGVPDRPDAAGLVEGDAADWAAGAVDAVDGPEAPAGAAPGIGLGLDAIDADPAMAGDRGPQLAQAGPAGMPMMPGTPGGPSGSPAASAGAAPDRPDASRLVAAEDTEWTPTTPAADIDGQAGGIPAAGIGLTTGGPFSVPMPVFGVIDPPTSERERERAVGALPHVPGAGVSEAAAAVRPEAAALLVEAAGAWGATAPEVPADEVVPLLRLDDVDADVAAWDDTDGSWLLADEPGEGRDTDG
ncbi:hypothetical protein Q3V37_18745 [Micromonospora profundi]|uniref:Uncharacterized protein n=1 Tax=Micromonospora profundi TaxID=1420889 RepID=A0AAJ6HNS6_9ACTN|nr:hypothetical protein [Micromonospora profundi]WLS43442.1 hypothetical protein Q3V37_18745 [Micromonospora profundi]